MSTIWAPITMTARINQRYCCHVVAPEPDVGALWKFLRTQAPSSQLTPVEDRDGGNVHDRNISGRCPGQNLPYDLSDTNTGATNIRHDSADDSRSDKRLATGVDRYRCSLGQLTGSQSLISWRDPASRD